MSSDRLNRTVVAIIILVIVLFVVRCSVKVIRYDHQNTEIHLPN